MSILVIIKARRYAFMFIMISAQAALGQVNLDSLMGVWNDPKQPDTSRLKAMHDIAWDGYLFTQPDSAFYFAQLEYNFAKSKGHKKQMVNALHTQGVSLYRQRDYARAIDQHTRGLTISEEMGDKKGIASSLNFIGIIYKNQGNYALAIDNYTRSLTIREEIGDKKGIASSLNNIGLIYNQQGNYARAINFHTRSLTIKEEIGDKKGIASSLNNIGLIYWTQGDYTSAIDYHTRSLTIKEEMGDKKGIATSLNNIGNIYDEQGDYASAIDYHTRSLTIKEEIGYKKGIAISLNNIGNIYYEQGDYASAIDYYTRSLIIKEEIGDKKGIATSLNNIGSIYDEQDNYTSAMDYHTRSLTIREEIGDKRGVAYSLNNIGNIYKEQGDYTSAIDYYTRSLTILEEIGDKQGIAISSNNIGLIYKELGNFASAIAYGTRALIKAQEIGAAIETREAANALYEAYNAIGKHKPALEMHELYTATRDRIASEENQREVIRQEYQYAYQKQAVADSILAAETEKVANAQIAAQQARLTQEKTQRYALYGGVGLLLMFGGFIYNRFRISREQKVIIESTLEELKQTQTQLVQSEKMASLGQLSAGIAHEINNPVNFVNVGSINMANDLKELMRLMHKYEELGKAKDAIKLKKEINDLKAEIDYDFLKENLTQTVEDIITGAKRTTEIVKGLSNFSRIDTDDQIMADIHEGLDSSLTLLQHELKNKVTVTKDYDKSIQSIPCYPGQLNQVFMNILRNAIDAIDDKGKIIIKTKKLEEKIEISIKDNGSGMNEAVKTKIFDPFFTTKDVGKGTGLGLAISYGIIENHGGTIDVESREGEESEFVISLPISE